MTTLLDQVFASNTRDAIYYVTLEFNHSAFRDASNNPTSIRLVRGFSAITATLESTAPKNPSTAVTFQPGAFDLKIPVKDGSGRHDMQIVIDAANGEIIRQLERVVAAPREPIQVIFREFVSTDLSAPQSTPIKMVAANPQVTSTRATVSATFADLINKAFPSTRYTLSTHPGLA